MTDGGHHIGPPRLAYPTAEKPKGTERRQRADEPQRVDCGGTHEGQDDDGGNVVGHGEGQDEDPEGLGHTATEQGNGPQGEGHVGGHGDAPALGDATAWMEQDGP